MSTHDDKDLNTTIRETMMRETGHETQQEEIYGDIPVANLDEANQ